MRSQFGLCWRTGYWNTDNSVTGCDGDLGPPIAKPTAPAIVPAPAVASIAATPPSTLLAKSCDFSVVLGSDQSFSFGKAHLASEAKTRIDDEILGKLTSCEKITAINVIGHADQLGSAHVNQKLSEQRAKTVAEYLQASGVSAPIHTSGAGKSQPIKTCKKELRHKQLIECLAPNRRVVIEVQGLPRK